MSFDALIAHWGLPAIFLGCVVEGDATAFLGGVLAHRGLFHFETVAATVAAGAFFGDETLYFLGRHAGRFPWVQRMLTHGPVAKVQRLIHRYPVALILGMRFLYGTRTVGALSLGAAGVPPRLFVPLNLLAVVVWAHVFTGLGYGLGVTLHRFVGEIDLKNHLGIAVAIAVVVGLIAWALHHRWRNGSRGAS